MNDQQINILVVDDTKANLLLLTKLLSMEGYNVRPFSEGARALDSAKTTPPDLILLDIRMPNMDGYEVCKQLKANEHTCDIPVIFISALDELLDKVKAFSVGGVDFVTKPFQAEEIFARIKTHVDLQKLQKKLQEKNNQLHQEIIERKRAEESLKQLNEELEQRVEDRTYDLQLAAQQIQEANTKLAQAYDETLIGWARALELRDKETNGHSVRVTETTVRLARAMGINEDELIQVRRGALLHDVGKMGIPDNILLKPGPLTPEERKIMSQHSSYAYEMLLPIAYLRPALEIPYCHHERWDGTGYPRGLKGEEIPLSARIFAVIDVWDALIFDRPYRRALTMEEVREHIRQGSNAHFDPQVVEAFLALPLDNVTNYFLPSVILKYEELVG